ncbi:hypothetical protein BUALT_Bualt18G0016800 [Buddleja alternifolia]|uniref:ATP-dependent DNA helicase n=1 Tax=Buddleja alternifolia TaxID=168488 RepID=A0AAV6WAB0_9LAMI|nr:hypothetical protein BUALT_Bualt18G0016800 [Buddleja alternifolia]
MVDNTFRNMLGMDLPFGGKVMILGGDFRQVSPVVINGTKAQIINASIVESYLWSNVKVLHLSENMRAQDDQRFSDFLLRIGNGEEPTIENDMIRIPDSMSMPWEGEHSIDELIRTIFPNLSSHMYDVDYMEGRAIITPLNDDVDKLNEKALDAFPGEEVTYYSFDSVADDARNLLDISSMSNMHSPSNLSLYFSITIIILVLFYHCDGRDSISVRNPLSGIDQTLVSAGNRFELGFFTTEKSNINRYIGIWYYELIPRTIVWVANRDAPFLDSCSVFGVAVDGNLKVWCSNGPVFPITSLDHKSAPFNTILQLLDSGNLKLFEGQKGHVLWQSFDNPTDTFLPGMKMNDNMELTSWIDQNDPGPGNYTFKRDQGVYSINKRSSVYWKSGESGIMSSIFNELPYGVEQILSDFDTSTDQSSYQPLVTVKSNKSISFPNYTRSSYYNNTRILMNSSGEIQYYLLDRSRSIWSLSWSEPTQDSCSVYDACGKFAVCDVKKDDSMCRCLPGFKSASSLKDWTVGQYSDGCERESIICPNNATYKLHDERFVNLSLMKVGGQVQPFDRALEAEECKKECLNNCKCEAYSFTVVTDRQTGTNATNCWIWISESELVNLQQEYSNDGFHLFLRVPPIASAPTFWTENSVGSKKNSKRRYVTMAVVLVAGVLLVLGSSYILYRRRGNANGTGNQEENPVLFSYESERQVNDFMDDNDKKALTSNLLSSSSRTTSDYFEPPASPPDTAAAFAAVAFG